MDRFEAALARLESAVMTTSVMEQVLEGKVCTANNARSVSKYSESPQVLDPVAVAKDVINVCGQKRKLQSPIVRDVSDAQLSKQAHFTDKFNLKAYEHFMHYVPRLVNIVTVCYCVRPPSVACPHSRHCSRSWQKPYQCKAAA